MELAEVAAPQETAEASTPRLLVQSQRNPVAEAAALLRSPSPFGAQM